MENIKDVLGDIDSPILVIDIYDQIIFLNDSFESRIVSRNEGKDINNLQDYLESKEVNEVYNIAINYNSDRSNVYTSKNNIFKLMKLNMNKLSDYKIFMLVDITKEAEEYRNSNIDVLQTVIDNIPGFIFYKDKNLRYEGANKEYLEFLAKRGVTGIIGKTYNQLPVDSEFLKNCATYDNEVLKTKKEVIAEEVVNSTDNESIFIKKTIKTPVIDANGEVAGVVGIVKDITDQKKLENKLRRLSYTDKLTQLYNRAYFDKFVHEKIEENELPIGIIMGDINGLKIVNDTLGHFQGDKLIKGIAKVLENICGKKGLVFRWGGDEFITVLANATDGQCKEFISKVNEMCSKNKYENFNLSISQGYSILKSSDGLHESIKEAEDMAYKQKLLNTKVVKTSILGKLKKKLQERNVEIKKHSDRVAKYAVKIADKLGMSEEDKKDIALLGKMHDIGKVGIPEKILSKPAALNEKEYEIMKTHADRGYRLAMLMPELSGIARDILTHHERWDGKGYPLGLKGEEISTKARIISVVDSYDAMVYDRTYRKLITKEQAIDELRTCAGTQFDPEIVEIFCQILKNEK